MVIFDFEGELFFGASPEFEGYLDSLRKRVDQGARVLLLRVKRTRNPDMVCMELLQHFLQDMRGRGVTVFICGVREDFANAMRKLRFHHWLPADCVFHEDGSMFSSTLKAVRRAYELLGQEVCATCPRRGETVPVKGDWYYMI
jgi:SulP family sulfate permease